VEMSLVKLSNGDLFRLKNFYKVDWPLHIITFNTIKKFIERSEKFPEWKQKVSFWCFEGDWRRHGSFVMVNKDTNQIFFNTLESAPYTQIQAMLPLIPFSDTMVFINTRNVFRQMVKDIAKELQMNVVYESVCDCYIIPKDRFKNVEIV
jgi:hypothetical protein